MFLDSVRRARTTKWTLSRWLMSWRKKVNLKKMLMPSSAVQILKIAPILRFVFDPNELFVKLKWVRPWPPTICFRPDHRSMADNSRHFMCTSITCLPLLSLTFVVCYVSGRRGDWLTLVFCLMRESICSPSTSPPSALCVVCSRAMSNVKLYMLVSLAYLLTLARSLEDCAWPAVIHVMKAMN